MDNNQTQDPTMNPTAPIDPAVQTPAVDPMAGQVPTQAPVAETPVSPVMPEPVTTPVPEPTVPVVEEPIAPVVETPVAPNMPEPVAPQGGDVGGEQTPPTTPPYTV